MCVASEAIVDNDHAGRAQQRKKPSAAGWRDQRPVLRIGAMLDPVVAQAFRRVERGIE